MGDPKDTERQSEPSECGLLFFPPDGGLPVALDSAGRVRHVMEIVPPRWTRCRDCRFWRPRKEDEGTGTERRSCKRHAPHPVGAEAACGVLVTPYTSPDHGCGDGAPREEGRAD